MAMVQNLFNPVELGNSSTLRQRDNIFRSLWHIEKWKIIGQWLRIFFYFLLIRIRIQLLYSMQILIRIQLYLMPVGSSFKSLVKNTLWRVFCSLKKHTKILLKSIKKLSWPKFKKIPNITIIQCPWICCCCLMMFNCSSIKNMADPDPQPWKIVTVMWQKTTLLHEEDSRNSCGACAWR